MENKYFTPNIEDIRVGYECEIYEQSTNKLIKKVEWHPVKVIIGNSEYGESVAINRIPNYLKQDKIRVPYLTKEQIEAEEWKLDYSRHVSSGIIFCKENYTLWYWSGDLKLVWIRNEKDETLFKGECKDINTLRYIMKLLNIK